MDRAALAAGVLLALVIVTLPDEGAVHLTPFETTAPPVLSLDRSTRPAPPLVDEDRGAGAADRAAPLPRSTRPAPSSTADRAPTPAAPDEAAPVSDREMLRPCAQVEVHRVDAGTIPTAQQHDGVVTFVDGSSCRRP